MTAEQLEELLGGYDTDTVDRITLQRLAPSLAHRVLAAEKLVEEVGMYLTGSTGHRDLARAITAYREASK